MCIYIVPEEGEFGYPPFFFFFFFNFHVFDTLNRSNIVYNLQVTIEAPPQ